MASIASDYDSRFAEAESEVDRGEPWMFREDGAPNPLTIVATGWSSGHTAIGPAEFLNGVDREREGVVDSRRQRRAVEAPHRGTRRGVGRGEGRLRRHRDPRAGAARRGRELKYIGDREGGKFPYPDFRVSRKPAPASTSAQNRDGIPWD